MAGKKKERQEKKEKPLEKKTVKELREEALQIPDVVGVHGMNKEELITALREYKGIPAPEIKKSGSVRDLKKKVLELKQKRDEARAGGATRSQLDIMRRKISRIKKQTRG